MSKFEGFGPKVREWLKGLESDNSKQYFIAHRDFYEESIRDQMEALLSELGKDFGGEIKMFRQNRDIRFSRDKSPYKTNTYGILHGTAIAAQGRESSCCAARSSPRGRMLEFRRGIKRPEGLDFVAQTWRTAGPVTGWLDQHVGASTMPPRRR